MILIKTPLRVSLFGGGSDYPKFYNKKNGEVISFAINQYINLFCSESIFGYKYSLNYRKLVRENDLYNIDHPTFFHFFKKFDLQNLNIHYDSQIPSNTGLASSSGLTCSLIYLKNILLKLPNNKNLIFKEAIDFEQKIMKEPVGSQDPIPISKGGFLNIKFSKNKILPKNIYNLNKDYINYLIDNMVLVYSGQRRLSHKITIDKINKMNSNRKIIEEMVDLTKEAKNLINKQEKISKISSLMKINWELKKKLSDKVSNNLIDRIFEKAYKDGATAGKILGAGGGGFILFMVPKKNQKNFIKNNIYKTIKIQIDNIGIRHFSDV